MTVLITGSTGLIGSHLIRKLKDEETVISLVHEDPRGRFQRESLEGTVKVRGDVRDFNLLKSTMSRYYVDRVYHLAALAEVKSAYKEPLNVYDVNVMGTVNVLEAARQIGVKRSLVLITDKVYGEQLKATEKAILHSSEPYATSKVAAQLVAQSYVDTYGMDVVFPHSPNAFGLDYGNRIFPNTIRKCLMGQPPVIFTNDQSIREYIYVEDLVEQLKGIMEGAEEPGSYNIETGWVYDQRQVVEEVLKSFPRLSPDLMTVNLPQQIQAQTMKSTRWSWSPGRSFGQAVVDTIAKFKEYEDDWRYPR